MQTETPNYYAVIPASVRYDHRCSFGARIIYGEISALCSKDGYCWATNKYFADLYKVNTGTISRWIQELNDADHIYNEVDSSGGTHRKIYIRPEVKIPLRKNKQGVSRKIDRPSIEKSTDPLSKNRTHINTVNTTSNTTLNKEQIVSDLSQPEKIKVEKTPSEPAPKNEPLQGAGAKPKSDGLEKIEKGRHEMKEAATVFEQGLAVFNEARAKQDVICWDQKEMKQLKTLLTRIKAAMKESGKDYNDPEQVMIGLRFAMQLFTKHTLWFTDRFLPSNFVSHWSDILNMRNGVKAKPATNGADKKQNINSLADALSGAMEQIYQ